MNKQTIVITGSSRGIGLGLASEFLRLGHQVVINGRSEEVLSRTVSELVKISKDVIGVPGSISDNKTHFKIIENCTSNFGKIDIWINNAGIPQPYKQFIDLDITDLKNIIDINIFGLVSGTQIALKQMILQGHGKIFNLEGLGSDGRIMNKLGLYGTSKRAVQYFSKSVSKELKEENIRVGILSPGMVKTDFLKESMTKGDSAEQKRTRKVLDILAEDLDVVTGFLVKKILKSTKQYDRIEYLTFRRLFPKLLKLMFVR